MHRDRLTLSDSALSLWRQNPLLETLPVLSIPAAQRQLNTSISQRPNSFWSLPLAARLEHLVDLQHFFWATPQEADCLQSLIFCMRDSYTRRNPNDPVVYRELVNQGTRIDAVTIRPLMLPNAKAQMVLLRGGRGVGISAFLARIEAVLGSDARAITLEHQPSPRVFHIQTLRLQWPSCGTELGLGRALLAAIDARLSSTYLHNAYRKSALRAAILPRAQTLASLLSLGLLLVDNGKFGTLDDGACVALLPILERFSAQTGIPIVIALDDDSMLHVTQRRGIHLSAAGTRERVFKPLTLAGVERYVSECWKLRVSHKDAALPEWLPNLAHAITGGSVKPVTELLVELFRSMANRPDEALSVERLCRIAEHSIRPYVLSGAVPRVLPMGSDPVSDQSEPKRKGKEK